GSTGDDAITVFGQTGGQGFRVNHYLSLVFAKLRLQCFMKTDRFRGDDVHKRAALHARKNRGADLLREFFFAHHDAATWTAQTFVSRGGYELCVRNRARMLPSCDQTGYMRHVDKENRAD